MSTTTLAEAKAHLSALVERAATGDSVSITRRGKPIARIIAAEQQRKPVDLTSLRRLTDSMPPQPVPAGDWVRQMRDEERY